MKAPTTLAPLLLGAWLILWGILNAPFVHLSFSYSADVLAGLAIAAGVVTLIRR